MQSPDKELSMKRFWTFDHSIIAICQMYYLLKASNFTQSGKTSEKLPDSLISQVNTSGISFFFFC